MKGDECTIELKMCQSSTVFKENNVRFFLEKELLHKLNMTKQHFSIREREGSSKSPSRVALLSSNIVHLHEFISKDCLVESFIRSNQCCNVPQYTLRQIILFARKNISTKK